MRTHAAQCETTLVVGIHELVRYRLHIGDDAEPAERIDAFVRVERIPGDARPAHAVVPVTARDEIALDLLRAPLTDERDPGTIAAEVVDRDVGRFVAHVTAGGHPGIAEVLLDFGLAVDRDLLAGETLEVNTMDAAGKGHLEAVVHDAFALESLTDSGLDQQIDSALLEQSRADARFDVLACLALENDG